MFKNQIEEPTQEELTKFHVLYKVIDTSKSLSELRLELREDANIKSLIS